MKNVLVLKMILFIDFTIIVRYIFKFHAKNPTAVQDEFWALFLFMWALGKNKFNFVHCNFALVPNDNCFFVHVYISQK